MPEYPESEAAIVGLDKEIEHAPRCPDQGPGGEYRMFLEQVAATRLYHIKQQLIIGVTLRG